MKKEIKKTSGSSLVTFKKLTIASTVIAWLAFVLAVAAAVAMYILIINDQEISEVVGFTAKVKPNAVLILTIPALFALATLGLTIGQSVFAKRVGQLTPKIGFEQVICILVMLVGLGTIALPFVPHFYQLGFGYTGDEIIKKAFYEFGMICGAMGAIFLLGASVYNTILCAKVTVKK